MPVQIQSFVPTRLSMLPPMGSRPVASRVPEALHDSVQLSGQEPPRSALGSTAHVARWAVAGALSSLAGPIAGIGIGALSFGVLGAFEGMRQGASECASQMDNEGALAGAAVGGVIGAGLGAIGGVVRGIVFGVIGGFMGPAGGAALCGGLALAGEVMARE